MWPVAPVPGARRGLAPVWGLKGGSLGGSPTGVAPSRALKGGVGGLGPPTVGKLRIKHRDEVPIGIAMFGADGTASASGASSLVSPRPLVARPAFGRSRSLRRDPVLAIAAT